jgi:hypothetical protein
MAPVMATREVVGIAIRIITEEEGRRREEGGC